MKDVTLRAYWQQVYTFKEFADKTKEFLNLLNSLTPKFANLVILKAGLDKTPITDNYSNFNELFFKGAYDKEAVYTNLDEKKEITANSVGPFYLTFSNRRKETEDQFSIRFWQNSYVPPKYIEANNFIQIDFPENDPAFFELEFCKKLLELTATFWKAEFANIYTFDFKKKTKSIVSSFGGIGWLNYFPPSAVLDYVTTKDAESIITSSDGSCIIILTEPMPDHNNQEHIDKAIKLRDKLMPTGLLNWQKP